MKHNYKCLEEQHYKAQERVQSLLKEMNVQEDVKGPSSLYPCDQCTKNFLTLDSLKSHQQRKHTVIGEKHELSDDNEKENGVDGKHVSPKESPNKLKISMQSDFKIPQKNNPPSNNNNNNDFEPNAETNCMVCSKKARTNLSSIAIQCEVSTFSNKNSESQNIQQVQVDTKTEKEPRNNGNKKNTMYLAIVKYKLI